MTRNIIVNKKTKRQEQKQETGNKEQIVDQGLFYFWDWIV